MVSHSVSLIYIFLLFICLILFSPNWLIKDTFTSPALTSAHQRVACAVCEPPHLNKHEKTSVKIDLMLENIKKRKMEDFTWLFNASCKCIYVNVLLNFFSSAASMSLIQQKAWFVKSRLNECIYLELASELADVYRRVKLCYNLSIFLICRAYACQQLLGAE